MSVRRRRNESHRLTYQIKTHSERHGNTWIRRFGCETSSVVERVFKSRDTSNWTILDVELDVRHGHLIIKESGCNANTKTVCTPREKLQDKLVCDGRKSPILKREDVTRYSSACMRLSHLAQDRSDLVETAKHSAQRMREPREFDFCSIEARSTVLCRVTHSCTTISKTRTR